MVVCSLSTSWLLLSFPNLLKWKAPRSVLQGSLTGEYWSSCTLLLVRVSQASSANLPRHRSESVLKTEDVLAVTWSAFAAKRSYYPSSVIPAVAFER